MDLRLYYAEQGVLIARAQLIDAQERLRDAQETMRASQLRLTEARAHHDALDLRTCATCDGGGCGDCIERD